MGSWIAYAAAFGAKVSLWGDVATYSREDYAADRFMSENPAYLDRYLEATSPKGIAARFPWLVQEPGSAQEREEWGAGEIGMGCRRHPRELADLLGWNDRTLQRRYHTRILPTLWLGRVRFYAEHGVRIARKRLRAFLER
jgi:hypothetical protein